VPDDSASANLATSGRPVDSQGAVQGRKRDRIHFREIVSHQNSHQSDEKEAGPEQHALRQASSRNEFQPPFHLVRLASFSAFGKTGSSAANII
jgi:hypothetical protein